MRKNPTITTSSKGMKPVFEGIDNLPNPSGKNMDVQEEGNVMPDVDRKKNDGDNPSISSGPAFASGKDGRNRPSDRGSNPWPAKPGC